MKKILIVPLFLGAVLMGHGISNYLDSLATKEKIAQEAQLREDDYRNKIDNLQEATKGIKYEIKYLDEELRHTKKDPKELLRKRDKDIKKLEKLDREFRETVFLLSGVTK